MNEKTISAFEVGDKVVGFYLIKAFNVKTSSNNNLYLDINLQDKTGTIDSKLWNITNNEHENYDAGDIVKVKGTVTSWRDNLQFKIEKIRHVTDEDGIELDELVPCAPFAPEEMLEEIYSRVNGFENDDIKNVTNYILEEYREKLLTYPAAKSNHHSIRSGLLFHIKRMLEVGESLAQIYTNINKDLLFAGIILHDIEKVNEMIADDLGIVSDYSKEGKMLGHLIMGVKNINKVCKSLEVDPEVSIMLEHMILSHHYHPEFGSPKRPMFLEAELLHYIDLIDARVYDFTKINRSLENEGFSEPIYTLDRRRVYRSSLTSEKDK